MKSVQNIRPLLTPRPLWALGFASLLCLTVSLVAQPAPKSGTLTGRVTNEALGYALSGAVVNVRSAAASVLTQSDGTYSLTVPAGVQEVEVSYTGLDTMKTRVTVTEGATVTKDFAMTSEIYKLEEVVVKGVLEGNADALQAQRYAENQKQVVAADSWGLPAVNPGELLQRLASISVDVEGAEQRTIYLRGLDTNFLSVQVDGNTLATSGGSGGATRSIQMETMGMSNIESVEVVKQNTPDRDANAVAGYVNMISRRGFDRTRRSIKLTGGIIGRLNTNRAAPAESKLLGGVDVLGFEYNDSLSVFGKKRNLGVSVSIDSRNSATVQDEMGSNAMLSYTQQIRNNVPISTCWGGGFFYYPTNMFSAATAFDYKIDDAGSYVYLKARYNHSDNKQTYYRWGVYAPIGSMTAASDNMFSEATAAAANYATTYSGAMRKKSANYALNGGFSKKLFNRTGTLDFDWAHSYALIWYPGSHQIQSKLTNVGYTLDFRGTDKYVPILTQTAGADWTNLANYTPTSEVFSMHYSPTMRRSFRLDYKQVMPWRVVPTYLKVGAKYSMDVRSQDKLSGSQSFWDKSAPANVGKWQGPEFGVARGAYLAPFTGIPGTGKVDDILTSGYLIPTASEAYTNTRNTIKDDANLTEKISSWYTMANARYYRFTLVGGFRWEITKNIGTAWVDDPSSAFNALPNLPATASISEMLAQNAKNVALATARYHQRLTTKGSYRNVFPSATINTDLGRNTILRTSFGTSISRPNPVRLLPIDTVNDDAQTVTGGNPTLRPYTSRNWDVTIEKYFEPVGQISASWFYKEISNYIASTTVSIGEGANNGFGGQYAGYDLVTYGNIGRAFIRGYELSYQQQFTFLPGFWRGFGFMANKTYVDSEGDYGNTYGAGKKGPLASNMTPHQANLSLTFRRGGLDLRLMCNIRGRTLYSYSPTNPLNTIWRQEWRRWDFKAQYTWARRYTAFLTLDNLTDSANWTYEKLGRSVLTYKQGVGVLAGMSVNL